MAGLRVAAPLLALQQGHSAFAVGLLFAMFGLTQVFLAVPSGRYVDRVGLRHPVAWAVCIAIAGTSLPVIWPHYISLCLASLTSGGAVGFAVIALQRHVGRAAQSPTELKQVFSWLGLGPSLSNFLGPVIAGVLIDTAGFRVAFAALALMPLITWAMVRTVRELPPVQVPAGEQSKGAFELLRGADFRRLLLVNWMLSSCWDVHSFMVPVIGHEHGFSASTIGLVVGSFAFAATAVRLVLPVFAERLREWVVIVGVMVGAGLILAVYPFLVHPLAMGVGSLCLGFVLGAVQPMMLSTLHQITPDHRHGEALGLRAAVSNLSSVVMPMAFGAAGAAVGAKAVFWAMGAASLSCIPLGVRMRLPDHTSVGAD